LHRVLFDFIRVAGARNVDRYCSLPDQNNKHFFVALSLLLGALRTPWMTSPAQRLEQNRQGRNLETVGSRSGLARWARGRSTLVAAAGTMWRPSCQGEMACYINTSAVHSSMDRLLIQRNSVSSVAKVCNSL
jgi:hypothetical protein